MKDATTTYDKKVTGGIALDHNNGTNSSDLNDNLTCHRSTTVDSVTNDNSVTCLTMTKNVQLTMSLLKK